LEADDKDYPDICDLEVVEDANRPDPIDEDNHNVNGLFGMAYDIMHGASAAFACTATGSFRLSACVVLLQFS
jgi:hypothetical protein